VSPFRSGGNPTEIAIRDAHMPMWSPAGDELFFGSNGRLLVTRMRASASGTPPTFTEPVLIYEPATSAVRECLSYCYVPEYDVMPDGGSVLVKVPASPEIVVVPDVWSRRIQ
jgi:hypothetical protein